MTTISDADACSLVGIYLNTMPAGGYHRGPDPWILYRNGAQVLGFHAIVGALSDEQVGGMIATLVLMLNRRGER